MNCTKRTSLRLIAFCAVVSAILPVWAQDAPRRAKPVAKPLIVPPATAEDRTVEAVLETKPEQPDELVRAIEILIDLRRPDAAKPLMAKLKEADLDQAALAALGRKFGVATFMKLSAAEALQPEGAEMAASVREAVRKHTHDSKTLNAWIKQLSDPDTAVRDEAISDLRGAGADAVVALVKVLANAGRAGEHAVVGDAIVAQGEEIAAPVLIGALDAAEVPFKTQVIGILSRLNSQQAVPYLLAPAVWLRSELPVRAAAEDAVEDLLGAVPSLDESATMLYSQARSYYELQRPLNPDIDDLVEIWSWEAAKKAPAVRKILAADASLAYAARLSLDLDLLLPTSQASTRLYLGSLLESASFEAGLDQPLPRGAGMAFDIAAARGTATIHDLLQDALVQGRARTATSAVQVLTEIGSADLLNQDGAHPSALLAALRSSDRRLRFAALTAIMRYQPTVPFPGSSDVLDSLLYFVGAAGSPRALVADTRFEQAQTLAGLLRELGFEVDLATTSAELLQLAAAAPHELAVIDMALPRWPIDQVLQRLRRDSHSGAMPIGLIAPLDADDRPEVLARRDPLIQVWMRPIDAFGMQAQTGRLLALVGRNRVTDAERAAHARQSLVWLGELAAQKDSLYELRRGEAVAIASINDPDLFAPAVDFLTALPLAGAQRALVDQASQSVLPLPVRQAAAKAFQQSLVQHGPLLNTEEIELQYERYNQSELLGAETQQLMGFILDCLEAGRVGPQNVPGPSNQ